MSYQLRFAILVVMLASLLRIAPGQQPAWKNSPTDTQSNASVDDEMTIRVGQPLAETERVLRARQIGFHEGGFAFARLNADQANLFFKLDEDHAWACIFYSKSGRTVTGISLVFFPSKAGHGKANESWLRAKSLRLNPDRSYVAHFAPPLTDDEREQLRRSRPQPQLPRRPAETPSNGY